MHYFSSKELQPTRHFPSPAEVSGFGSVTDQGTTVLQEGLQLTARGALRDVNRLPGIVARTPFLRRQKRQVRHRANFRTPARSESPCTRYFFPSASAFSGFASAEAD